MRQLPLKIRDLTNETFIDLEDDLEEMTTTSATPGHDSKYAFKKPKKQKPIIDVELNEGRLTREEREWNEKNPTQKVGSHIRTVVNELKKIEHILKDAERIKAEGNLKSGSYWSRTKKGLSSITERMTRIGHTIKRLQA